MTQYLRISALMFLLGTWYVANMTVFLSQMASIALMMMVNWASMVYVNSFIMYMPSLGK